MDDSSSAGSSSNADDVATVSSNDDESLARVGKNAIPMSVSHSVNYLDLWRKSSDETLKNKVQLGNFDPDPDISHLCNFKVAWLSLKLSWVEFKCISPFDQILWTNHYNSFGELNSNWGQLKLWFTFIERFETFIYKILSFSFTVQTK